MSVQLQITEIDRTALEMCIYILYVIIIYNYTLFLFLADMYVSTYVRRPTYAYMCVCSCVCVCARSRVCVWIYIYIYIYIYVCVCVCVCVCDPGLKI